MRPTTPIAKCTTPVGSEAGNEKMTKTPPCLTALLVLAANSPAFCEEASLEEMKQRCQQAREAKIARNVRRVFDYLRMTGNSVPRPRATRGQPG